MKLYLTARERQIIRRALHALGTEYLLYMATCHAKSNEYLLSKRGLSEAEELLIKMDAIEYEQPE